MLCRLGLVAAIALSLATGLVGQRAEAAYAPGTYSISCPTCFSAAVSVTTTTATALSPVPGAGLYAYIIGLSCSNTGSSTTTVTFQNGSAGATIWGPMVVPATTGAFVSNFTTPIGGDTTLGGGMTAATAVYFKAATATTSLSCSINGYMAP